MIRSKKGFNSNTDESKNEHLTEKSNPQFLSDFGKSFRIPKIHLIKIMSSEGLLSSAILSLRTLFVTEFDF